MRLAGAHHCLDHLVWLARLPFKVYVHTFDRATYDTPHIVLRTTSLVGAPAMRLALQWSQQNLVLKKVKDATNYGRLVN